MGVYANVTLRYADVQIDLGEIDTEDLRKELMSRKAGLVDMPPNAGELMGRLHVALKLGQDDQALVLARSMVSAQLGVIL